MTVTDVLYNDLRLIRRDAILAGLLGFVVYIGVVLRFGLPWLDGVLAADGIMPSPAHPEPFSVYYPAILSLLVVYTGAVMGGTVFGLLVLSEKDDHTMAALLASPLSPGAWVGRRIALSTMVSVAIVLFLFATVGQAMLPWWQLVLVASGASLAGPITMLGLAVFADGRVQGMNYAKTISFGGYLTLLSWWVDDPLQLLFGLFPPYWISKAYWAALEGSGWWPVFLAVGVVYQAACLWGLHRLFVRRIYDVV